MPHDFTKTIDWYGDLILRLKKCDPRSGNYQTQVAGWVAEAESALASVFPASHPLRARWRQGQSDARNHRHIDRYNVPEIANIEVYNGIMVAAVELLKSGRSKTLIVGIRAETACELIEQAEALLATSHHVAAMVLAGGALETHLRTLCASNGVSWAGGGSISQYETALAQQRNAGNEIISLSESKQITAWGGLRNDAAHSPLAFSASSQQVSLAIQGIRDFVARKS